MCVHGMFVYAYIGYYCALSLLAHTREKAKLI